MMTLRKSLTALLLGSALTAAATSGVRWLETYHNFGAFDENDGKVTTLFRFVNDSAEPVAIKSARATCGCTAPEYPRRQVATGDTATISVTYDPTGRPGHFEKKVYVDIAEADSTSRTTLRIEGVVIGSANTLRSRYPVDAGAMRLRNNVVSLGDITKGKNKMAFFDVYNVTSDSITPQWSGVPKYVHISTISPTVPPGEQSAYAINFISADADIYGILVDSLAIQARPGDAPVKVDLIGMVNEDFSQLTPGQRQKAPRSVLSTDAVDFGEFSSLCTAYGHLELTNSGSDALLVRRVYTTDPGVSVRIDKTKIKKGKHATIDITVEPRQLPSELLNARIILITNDPDNPVRTIRAVGLPR